jgi:hypothetical protein
MAFTVPLAHVELGSLDSAEAPVFATIPQSKYAGPSTVRIVVQMDGARHETRTVTAPFLGPPAPLASRGAP